MSSTDYFPGFERPVAKKAVTRCTAPSPPHGGPPFARNRLLGALEAAELRALSLRLDHVRLYAGRTLLEADEPVRHVLFPTSGIVSLLYANAKGATAELTVVGCEGAVGLAPLLGAEATPSRAVVQAAGGAYRLRAADAKAAFDEGRGFQGLMLRYVHLLTLQLSQTAFCNLHHVVEQQMARWLLACLDRIDGSEIETTHELIAGMLGVRRQGITEAARKLQERKVIAYSRGRITVLDRGALEGDACECYHHLRRHADALFAGAPG